MAASTRLRLLADENDLQAVRTDPSGFLYAVLQVLRAGEDYAEADFQALIERGRTYALEQGGLGRSAVPVPARARAARAVPDPPTRIRAQRAPKKRITPSGEVSYAGTEAEAEAVAEAQRLREQGVGPVEFELDDLEQIEDEPGRVTLTNAQLARLMQTVAQKAIARSQAPTPETSVDVEVDDLEEDDSADDLEEDADDGASAHEAPPDATEESDRGRDDSGRFVTKPKRM